MSKDCKHDLLRVESEIVKIKDNKRFMAEIRIRCDSCKAQFSFIGLPFGLNYNGAAVDSDGTEARLAIAPREEVLSVLEDTPDDITARRPS